MKDSNPCLNIVVAKMCKMCNNYKKNFMVGMKRRIKVQMWTKSTKKCQEYENIQKITIVHESWYGNAKNWKKCEKDAKKWKKYDCTNMYLKKVCIENFFDVKKMTLFQNLFTLRSSLNSDSDSDSVSTT